MATSTVLNNPLTTTSIILNLEIRKWAGEVSDKKALKAVADTFNSDTHNDKYKKSLFVNDPLAMVDRCAGRIRNHFYNCTVPWLDGGKGRLIPSLNFQDFAKEHSKLKMEFDNEVQKFLQEYPDHKELAKEKKGDLYQASEYPSVAQLQDRYVINLTTLPFPDINDFRINAPDAVIKELQQSMQESVQRVESVVSKEIQDRFVKRLSMLRKTLTVGKRFNKTLLTELAEVISMASNLKETISSSLMNKMLQARTEILPYSPEQIRNSVSIQEEILDAIDSILQHL